MVKSNMTNFERELDQLKKDIIKMMILVSSQLEKSEVAFSNQDVAIAKEIHHIERRVDASDLSIDKECENLIALYNPVAGDLRLILASIKIISNLERVGDHADKIARYVRKKQIKNAYPKKLLQSVKLDVLFDEAQAMMEIAIQAFIEEDSAVAREVFAKDIIMNEIYSNAITQMHHYAEKKDAPTNQLLYLFSVINKLERVGDLAKNIAEETIFYLDAKILKHHKVKRLEDLENL